ncbi:uncharacterized protein ACRADG_006985 [Cochliomyia hominivorax]
MGFQKQLVGIVLLAFVAHLVFSYDIKKTEIKTVTDETRYTVLHPNATYRPFDRAVHAKGNIIFTIGERIDGDRLLVTYIEQDAYNLLTDIEVSIWYPAEGHDGQIISRIEIVTDLSTSDAETYFVNGGGIGDTYCEILMAANRTFNFGYQILIFGY